MSIETIIGTPRAVRARRSLWRLMRRDVRAVLSLGYLGLLFVVSVFAAQIRPTRRSTTTSPSS